MVPSHGIPPNHGMQRKALRGPLLPQLLASEHPFAITTTAEHTH